MDQPLICSGGGSGAVVNLQPGDSMSIAYHPQYGPHDDLILLELDEKLLPDVMHQRVFLRGHPDEEAVLCTQSKTYAIKFVGTSNSACLVPPSSNQLLMTESLEDCSKVASVIKLAPGNMELVEVAPKLERLKSLLSENPYRLADVSDMEVEGVAMDKTGLYTWDDLVNEVQASDDEIKSGLEALSAVEIDGYWRIIDVSYIDMFLRMLFPNMVLNDWSPDELDEDKVLAALESDGFPHKITRHCLSVYSDLVNEGDGKSVRKLNAKRVCVHFARNILKQGKMKMERFTEQWMRQIPEGIQASLDMLEGEILTEKIGVETWIQGFSVHSLPSTPSERFSALFKERPRWEWKDLQPYIRDLNVPGLSSDGLLLKYTRRVQASANAEPIFTVR